MVILVLMSTELNGIEVACSIYFGYSKWIIIQ